MILEVEGGEEVSHKHGSISEREEKIQSKDWKDCRRI